MDSVNGGMERVPGMKERVPGGSKGEPCGTVHARGVIGRDVAGRRRAV
jgi:hypothetical protein